MAHSKLWIGYARSVALPTAVRIGQIWPYHYSSDFLIRSFAFHCPLICFIFSPGTLFKTVVLIIYFLKAVPSATDDAFETARKCQILALTI